MAQALDSPGATTLRGQGMLALAHVFQIFSPFYLFGAATMAGLHRWRGARDVFLAWILVVIAARAVRRLTPLPVPW
jgi:hypothetical protein